jgi:hypothetical protein
MKGQRQFSTLKCNGLKQTIRKEIKKKVIKSAADLIRDVNSHGDFPLLPTASQNIS